MKLRGNLQRELLLLGPSAARPPTCRSNSDYYPWDYCPSHPNIDLLKVRQKSAARGRHIQPVEGPLRAFGDALREVRKEKGLSQERLALDSGLDRTYVSLIERGSQSPTIRTVVKLAAVLQVRPSEIVLRMEALMSPERPPRARRKLH